MNTSIKKNSPIFIDTHCHINLLVKKGFDISLTEQQLRDAIPIIAKASTAGVKQIINIGTSIIESQNCIRLAQMYKNLFAVVGIHPCDLSTSWRDDIKKIEMLAKEKDKIVGIGETGIDLYRPGYHLQQQLDGFRAQIELALKYDLALVIHTRTAPEETLTVLSEYRHNIKHGVIHCYPYDLSFAKDVIGLNFLLGIGGSVTYPNNKQLQNIVRELPLDSFIFETDAPFLPPQTIRGKQNSPDQIATIAQFVAELTNNSLEIVAQKTTTNAQKLFLLPPICDNIES